MEFVLSGAVIFTAAMFRGVTGFGFALIAALGLVGQIGPALAVPLVLMGDLLLTALILLDRKGGAVDWSVARLLLVTGCAGAALGIAWSGTIDAESARLFVSIIVFASALLALVKNPPSWLASRPIGIGLGLFAGIVLGAFAVGGPIIVAWLLAGAVARDRVRSTLAIYFGVIDAFNLATRMALGTIPGEFPSALLTMLPFAFAGYGAGLLWSRHLKPDAWHRIAVFGLLAIALAGCVQTLLLLSRS